MKQVDKNILRLVYGISVKSLHQYDFLADSERSFGEGWEEDWREKVSNGSPSILLSCGWWRFVWRRLRENLGEEVEEL
ncbi:MAG: hypothetical protein HXO47_00705 [Prevotella sp.]|nr:hypothetical protein [Prevotella sp.]